MSEDVMDFLDYIQCFESEEEEQKRVINVPTSIESLRDDEITEFNDITPSIFPGLEEMNIYVDQPSIEPLELSDDQEYEPFDEKHLVPAVLSSSESSDEMSSSHSEIHANYLPDNQTYPTTYTYFTTEFPHSFQSCQNFDIPPAEGFCYTCCKTLNSVESLRKHFLYVHDDVNAVCSLCNHVSKTRMESNQHKKSHKNQELATSRHNGDLKKLSKSNHIFVNREDFEIFIEDKSEEDKMKYEEARKSVLLKKDVVKRMVLNLVFHTALEKWECKYHCMICLKDFTRAYDARRHAETHLNREESCNMCSRFFRGSMSLKNHISKYH